MKIQGDLTKLVASMAKIIRTITPTTEVARLRTIKAFATDIQQRCDSELRVLGVDPTDSGDSDED